MSKTNGLKNSGPQDVGPKGLKSALLPLAGQKRDVEAIRRDGWREFGVVAVPVDDARLKPQERSVLEGVGQRLWGARMKQDRT